MNMSGDRAERRFWDRLEVEGECRVWTGASHERGYGRLRWRGKIRAAHRVAWEIAHGQELPGAFLVLHHCDNPSCCNPDHLYLGSQADNMADRVKRGRTGQRFPRDPAELDRVLVQAEAQLAHFQRRVRELRAVKGGAHRTVVAMAARRNAT